MASAQGSNPADLPLIERLSAIPYTGAVTDILDEMGYRSRVLPHAIQSLVPRQMLCSQLAIS